MKETLHSEVLPIFWVWEVELS